MPSALDNNDLAYLYSLQQAGCLHDMYTYLGDRGYQYATLADGVVTGQSPAGNAAIEFMKNTADQQGKSLLESEISQIRNEMAKGYLDALKTQLGTNGDGQITHEITYDKAWDFHKDIFKTHDLGPDAWTLNTPFNLMDESVRQAYWETLLNNQSGPNSLAINILTEKFVELNAFSGNTDAWSWLNRMALSPSAIMAYFGGMLPEWLRNGSTLECAQINPTTNTHYLRARNWVLPRDPLALDLDGDGLETTGITASPTLFDHDGDGIRTGTGWLKGDDAFLVLDRNSNGLIDNGSELFGVDTLLSTGGKAANGFAALADLDSNHDGQFSNADAQFAHVRLWRDLNQDGISQAAELQSLGDAGIASIQLASTASNLVLAGGNVQSASSTYTKTNGSSGTVADVITSTSANLDLTQNPFYREFTDTLPLTEATRNLPEMHGSGAVRDLREAANDREWRRMG